MHNPPTLPPPALDSEGAWRLVDYVTTEQQDKWRKRVEDLHRLGRLWGSECYNVHVVLALWAKCSFAWLKCVRKSRKKGLMINVASFHAHAVGWVHGSTIEITGAVISNAFPRHPRLATWLCSCRWFVRCKGAQDRGGDQASHKALKAVCKDLSPRFNIATSPSHQDGIFCSVLPSSFHKWYHML